jgi:hypothetical protein
MEKTYVRKVEPENTMSELMLLGDEAIPEGFIITGNPRLKNYKTEAFILVENNIDFFLYEDSLLVGNEGVSSFKDFKDLIMSYFPPSYKPEYSNVDLKKMRNYLNSLNTSHTELDIITTILSWILGKPHTLVTIRGCCQGDWQNVIFPTKDYTPEDIEEFQAQYFNTGTEWIVHDEPTPPLDPSDICGYSVYLTKNLNVKEELAERIGVPVDSLVIYVEDGYERVINFKKL